MHNPFPYCNSRISLLRTTVSSNGWESSMRTQEGQTIIEASSSLIKALMCHSQPLHLLRENLVAIGAQHANVELVESFRVRVDGIFPSLGVESETKRSLCTWRGIGPSRLIGNVGRCLLGCCRQTAPGDDCSTSSGRAGTGEATCRAKSGPGRSDGCQRCHCPRKMKSPGCGNCKM